MKSLKKYLEYAIIGLVFGGMSLMIYWLFIPYNLLTSEGDTVPLQKVVEEGDTIAFQGKVFCNKGVDVKITRLVVNETGGIFLLPLEFYAPKEEICAANRFRVELPEDIPPGTWTLLVRHQYQPNFTLRTITLETRSLPFKVVRKGSLNE